MFLVEVGSVITSYYFILGLFRGTTTQPSRAPSPVGCGSRAVRQLRHGHGRGARKAQADALRKMRTETYANLVTDDGVKQVPATELRKGHVVVVSAGEIIPGDGEVIEASPPWTSRPSPVSPRR